MRNRRARGQALLESTLTLIVFLMMVMGILDFGQVMFIHQAMVQRVTSATRYAAIHPDDTTGIKNLVVFASTNPPDGASPFLGLQTTQVDVTRLGQGTGKERIQLSLTNYQYRFVSPGLAGLYTMKPVSTTIMVESAQ